MTIIIDELNRTGDVATRVAKGVALLDEQKPGWVGQVDLIKLDIRDPERCILGQTCEGFNAGLDELDVEYACEYGFDCWVEDEVEDELEDFYALTQEWKRVITILRQKQETVTKELVTV